MFEQRQRDAFHAKADAGRMGKAAVGGLDVEKFAEMILMIIEAQASGRLLAAFDRDQKLEFQFLIALARRHDLTGAAKEGIVGNIEMKGDA